MIDSRLSKKTIQVAAQVTANQFLSTCPVNQKATTMTFNGVTEADVETLQAFIGTGANL